MCAWINYWLSPKLTAAFRQPWLNCGLVALDKGAGKPRPIVLQEVMLKLVTGSITQANSAKLREAAGAWQHGVYNTGGAPLMV